MKRAAGIRSTGMVAALLALVAAVTAIADGPPPAGEPVPLDTVDWERWYELSLDDQTVGWMRRWRERNAEVVRTARQVHLRLERSGTPVVLETHSEFLETPGGDPVSASMRSRTGDADAWSHWAFTDAGIHERTGETGRVRERIRPAPAKGWLTPVAVDLLLSGRLEGAAERIRWRELDPESGLTDVTLELVAEGREDVLVDDRSVEATRWRVRGQPGGGRTLQWRSRDGRLLAETTLTPLGELRARLGDPGRVRAAAEQASAEILGASLLEPVGRLDPRWARVRFAVRLGAEPGDAGPGAAAAIPSGGPQAAEPGEPGWWLVTVDPRGRVTGERPPEAADLTATPLIDADDPVVRQLAAAAADRDAGGDGDADVAEAMRRRVRSHLEDADLGRLFDSASRAARERRGDCSEHAVLLAAMLRSRGIPARVAYGLVHADAFAGRRNVFAWHMWTRAWIGDRWVDLDATRPRAFGPTHIRLGESAGEQAVLQELTATLLGTGRIEIRVLGGER